MNTKKVCILGAGLSGISLGLSHENKGNQVTIFEKDLRVGGVLQSIKSEGFLMDYGANTLSIRTKKTVDFLKQYEILEHAMDANQESSKRFIIRKNRIISLPQGPLSFLCSSFLSPVGKLRLCLEPFIGRKKDNGSDETMAEFTKPLYKAMKGLQDASMWVAINGLTDQEQAAGVSVEYLRMFALAIMADMWARAAKVALEKLAESEGDAFYEAKLHSARFFMKKILPAHYSLLASIVEGAKPMMVMDEEMF